ncbi:HTH-type transcriptional regulator PgrR [mine drainage metagenome]|uniref:HTH-type transcriptional regulator PgrR n=1 Tax=mine drainage metagenome TaxID=410659 RepID=A0A1J5RBZ6_9ZZZZ
MNNKPLHFDELAIFIRVAECSSFTLAAEQLGLSKARVSTAVRELEAAVQATLLQRTTRRVRLSAEGERFVERSRELLADAERLQTMFKRSPGMLVGRLRVDLPIGLARALVIPRLPEFLRDHPRVEIDVGTTDRLVDPVREGFDCVVRVGHLADLDLVARRLGSLRMVNVGSPQYLGRYGVPTSLDELGGHRIVHYAAGLARHGAAWDYVEHGEPKQRPMRVAVTVNSTDAYQCACLAGLGLIQAPELHLRPLLDSGQLLSVLPEYAPAPLPVSLLYPAQRHRAAHAEAFMDWLSVVVSTYLASGAAGRTRRTTR